MTYEEFLQEKVVIAPSGGFDITENELSPILLPHQRDIVMWAVKGGNRAIFANFGLGKSVMQCEWTRLIHSKAGGKTLVICPLGVRQEIIRDAKMVGLDLRFIRRPEEMEDGHDHFITNYESVRDGKLDPNLFSAVSLDEASVLRSYGSKTYQEFLTLFRNVKYKLVNTATPSPNRYKELIHYAGFLGVMDTGESLTRFFKRDSTKANNLTLYPSKEKEFWMWMSSWAVFVQKPSDLGYSDEGYNLPDIEVVYHEIPNDYSLAGHDKWGQAQLFQNNAMGLSAAAKEKRDSMNARIAKVKEIVDASPDDHFVIWHTLEAERHEIQKAIPEAQSVWGSQNLEQREERIVGFGDGKFRILSTKPVIAGSGCNFQRYCHREIFSGIGYEFNDFIQAIHRVQRFQQEHPVRIDIVYTESEQDVLRALKLKWQQHNELTQKMTEIIKEYGLSVSAMSEKLKKAIGIKRIEVSGDLYTVANNDCVKEAHLKGDNSVDLIITSIPFSNHYQYSANYNDFGDTRNNDHFWQQMDFLTPELLRILKPGRLYCCHVKDRILFGNVTGAGAPTVSPFHAEAIFHAQKHGFDYMGMITVVTDVVRENNQTYRLGWTENSKDGSKMGVGSPEYVLLFRKPQTDRSKGYADVPVTHDKQEYSRSRWQVDAHAFWRDGGNRQMTPAEIAALGQAKLAKLYTDFSLQNVYNYEQHVKIGEELDAVGALPSTFMALAPGSHCADVWHDVVRMQTLNGEQSKQNLEQHICPLQYGIVDRLIDRYSNKGELVYDPFCGLGTVPYRAILKGRKGGGSELNTQYFFDSCQYLKAAEQEVNMPDLFSALEA